MGKRAGDEKGERSGRPASAPPRAFVCGAFDEIGSRQVRFLEEASRFGELHLLLWSDELCERFFGKAPRLTENERLYFLGSVRFVASARIVAAADGPNVLPAARAGGEAAEAPWGPGDLWIVGEGTDGSIEGPNEAKRAFCASAGLEYRVVPTPALAGFPTVESAVETGGARKGRRVLVTGSFDWLHTGHVRFFEEAATYGELFVVVGHDANIRLLKGEGHPLFPQEERRYLVSSVRFVAQALISTGEGWLDAEPEIRRLRPDLYVVNEDGDRPEKREYCDKIGMEYLVLKRTPKEGLPRRSSTELRGF